MSAPFSASSVNAIVAVVIVEISSGHWLVGRTSTISGTTMATPTGIAVAARQAASGYALRALPRRRTYTTSWDINPVYVATGGFDAASWAPRMSAIGRKCPFAGAVSPL
jgi:hypothetical protein